MALLSFCVSLRSVLHRAVGMHPAHCHRHGSYRICVHFVVPLSLRYIWSRCHHSRHHSPYSLELCMATKWNLQCRMRMWLFLQWFKVFVFTPCSNSSLSPDVAPSVAGGFCWGPLEQWGREHAKSEGLKCTSAQLYYIMWANIFYCTPYVEWGWLTFTRRGGIHEYCSWVRASETKLAHTSH